MTLRKPNSIPDTEIDNNFNRLYENKLESRYTRDTTSAVTIRTFQTMETGFALFSANGSAATVRTFALQERPGTIITAIATAQNAGFLASVTDVTQSHITITCTAWSQTTGRGFSLTTSDTVRVGYVVIGFA